MNLTSYLINLSRNCTIPKNNKLFAYLPVSVKSWDECFKISYSISTEGSGRATSPSKSIPIINMKAVPSACQYFIVILTAKFYKIRIIEITKLRF